MRTKDGILSQVTGFTKHRERMLLYLTSRYTGENHGRVVSCSGLSERSGRRIEEYEGASVDRQLRYYGIRVESFTTVQQSEVAPMLEALSGLKLVTLLELFVKQWSGVTHGLEKVELPPPALRVQPVLFCTEYPLEWCISSYKLNLVGTTVIFFLIQKVSRKIPAVSEVYFILLGRCIATCEKCSNNQYDKHAKAVVPIGSDRSNMKVELCGSFKSQKSLGVYSVKGSSHVSI